MSVHIADPLCCAGETSTTLQSNYTPIKRKHNKIVAIIIVIIVVLPVVAQMVKDLPAMRETQETQIRSLGQEDPMEKGMVTHSSVLARRIPWTEEPGGLVYAVAESGTTEQLTHKQYTVLSLLAVLLFLPLLGFLCSQLSLII